MRRLRRVSTVVFDCDSTLSSIEGIERLAGEHAPAIERMTRDAMDGHIPLEEVYGRRLELIRPTRARVDALGDEYIASLVPDAREVVAALRGEGIEVRVLSGGLRPPVVRVAAALGIESRAVAAVAIDFDEQGEYLAFDHASPLARSGGKTELLEVWRSELTRPIMLVGDGMTDLEARPVVDVFVAFAGVVARPPVVTAADLVVRARSLAPILPLALAGRRPHGAQAIETFEKGLALLDEEYLSLMPTRMNTE
jgi:phosphoserine phosphatase